MDTDFFFTGLLDSFHFDSSLLSTWNSPPSAAEFSYPSDQSPDCFLTSISDKSIDPYTNFESSLTSTLSSPTAPCSSDAFAIQDHVGKLSIASNSDDLSPPQSHHYFGDNANNSSYISPFNPSPNLQIPIMNHLVNLINAPPPVNPSPPQRVSEQISLGEGEFNIPIDMKSRKRQSRPKGKKLMDDAYKMEDEPNGKRSRLIKAENDVNEETQKPNCEPPKDYIHVRARRGQATDSHSLAERVRREKISERMKVLEDLVPGCNKVTGKALMLDEIINYVQSLQRQVEFLSMKLATVNHNTRLDFNIDNSLFKKDMFQPSGEYPLAALHPFDCTEIDGQLNCEFCPRSFEGN